MDNYELIRMLIEGDTLTFRDRLQSFIEQLPDNKRSVNKEGFFPLFVLGGFLALPDTELGESLGVKQVFFRVEKYKKNNKSYVNGVKFALLIKEQNKKDKLLFIVVYEKNPIVFDRKEVEYIKSKLNSYDTEETWHSIQIKHEDKVGIVVYDKCDDDLFPDKSASHKGELFVLKKRVERGNLERLITKYSLSDEEEVFKSFKDTLNYFDQVVQDYIIEKSGNFDHESDYHGLLSGFFVMLFKYRYNLKLYPELSLGEGYSDIVVLVRSQERLNNVIPIIVELKAGKSLAIQGDPFEQAKKYAEAFKYGPRRMITNNNNVIYAVLNFDLSHDRIEIGTTARDSQHLSPFLQLLLESDDKGIIYEQLKYLYYTIPNLSDNYYMYTSKILLGELMPAKAENGIWNKYIFQHDKGVSNDITSFGFLNSGKDQLVLLNVIRSDSRNKKINIDGIIEKDEEANIKLNMDESIQSSRNLKIKEVNLLLKTKKANIGEFENWCRKVQVNSYSNLDDYNEKKTQSFDGKCVKLDVDVNKLNGLLNKVVNKKVDGAQSDAEHHIGLFKEVSQVLLPFKELIDSEVDFQSMLHGLLMYYQESTSSKKLVGVISEVQTGGGKRIDIGVVGGEIFTGIELKFDKTGGIVPEGEELTTKAKEAESQLERYKKQPNNIKSLIDSEEARLFWAVFHKGANEPKLLIETRSEFYAFQLDHSSICLPPVSRRSFAIQKQKEDYFLLVKENCLRDIENLLSKNISVEIKDKYGRTPSHYAAKCARLDIVNLFYQKGANFKAKDKNGETPLDFVNLFLKGSGKDVSDSNKVWLKSWKPLHYAAYNNNVGIVQKIFELLFNESNKDINVRDGKYGYAPLNVAVYYNRTGMVEFFLDKNANIETEDIYGRTPLHHAVSYSTLNMTRLLCEKGANIKAKNKKGEIPLCTANQHNKVDMINFLLDRGTNIEASDFHDNTVLKLAYCIKGVIDKTNNNVPPDFEKLKNKLPKSVKNLVFASKVCITSVYSNEYLYAAADRLNYDKERRQVFTWVSSKKNNPPGSCGGDKQGMWKVQPYGDNLCITSVYSNEYLYAAADRLNYDKERRQVFTWVSSKKNNPPGSCGGDKQGMWKVQPYGDNLCITSVYSNEYLYAAADRLNYDKERRRVFTWVSSKKNNPPGSCGNDKQGMWKVEDFGSIRKRRDIQELESKMSLNAGLYVDVNITDKNHSSRKLLTEDSGNQPEIAASSGTRPSSWINDLFGWVKSSIGGLLGFRAALPEKTFTQSSISQISAPIDVNGTIMLLDLLIRKVTGQKYISTVDQSISPLEAQGYALNITEGFERVVEQAGLKSGVSMHRLNIDYMGMQKEITRKVMSGKFNEISGILKSYVEKACPGEEAGKLSPKKFEKFIAQFNKGLLNQSIEQILHNRDGTLEVDGAKQMSLEPQSYLSNASIQSHSKDKVSTCLSDVGVTKLGGNLNR
ncbi:ankyrin repeat domain-containing protein [Wolbachia endosymbiont (group B) of Philonthus cognatus]|uniref:ankyrin repeat domain-containing protein n=1 Tax=Wolbachia endosymbiont (group B) of Philonthus cognatus TaxID=2954047 RepID=UPI00221FAC50|nr:ankyrin repeat domain-containing protein [Wolbachia endosymbiont (group B) of Philonthus cognatus]